MAAGLEEAELKLSDISNQIEEAYTERESLCKSLSDLRSDISALESQIVERKDELEVLDKALKEKKAEAVSSGLFSDSNMQERIERAKQEQARERRQSLLERFIELPHIKPLWERFCALVERQRGRESHKDKGDRL